MCTAGWAEIQNWEIVLDLDLFEMFSKVKLLEQVMYRVGTICDNFQRPRTQPEMEACSNNFFTTPDNAL